MRQIAIQPEIVFFASLNYTKFAFCIIVCINSGGVACFEFRSPRLIQNPLFYIIALLHTFLYIPSSHIAASFTRRMIHPFDDTLVNSRLRWFFADSISHYVKHYRSVSQMLRLNNTFAFPNQHRFRQLTFPRLSKSTPLPPIDVPTPSQNNSTSAYPL